MADSPADIYLAGFRARCEFLRDAGQEVVDAPGVCGLLGSGSDSRIRLLVTDDRAYQVLSAALPGSNPGMINVFAQASRCTARLASDAAWTAEAVTAMVCPDLRDVPSPPLPSELTVKSVRRRDDDLLDSVPLEEAVAVATQAAPAPGPAAKQLGDFLRSSRSDLRLLAAVDHGGTVRATSGFEVVGGEATVLFVNTEPGWRRRGVGLAMTAWALRGALAAGAKRARLDSSDAGLSIYRQLGFATVAPTTRYRRLSVER